ncbi:hypothetical protein B0H17DRAFT_699784 [Mycena rosella]|uniref:Uncharacterized protein n=1 Tax=Mycena rosella TaxID=1033263 RepID=A0AAD7DB13_MYCRO|nr:hypothetical protein B0H17DRAFT_699784 [Mycena rosella]
MVRSVVLEPPNSAGGSAGSSAGDGPRSVKDMGPREPEAYRENHLKKVQQQLDSCPKGPALVSQGEMMALLQAYGHPVEGKYGLLARGNTVYEFEQMFWVDVVRGDAAIGTLFGASRFVGRLTQCGATQRSCISSAEVEAVLGHKEAVWMFWQLLKGARSDTPEGVALIKDEHIASQLQQEFSHSFLASSPRAKRAPPDSERTLTISMRTWRSAQ